MSSRLSLRCSCRTLVCRTLVLALALLGPAAIADAEMFKYVDSKGRVHFTQDIGQVPPEYRNQVERKVLKKEISITGEGKGAAGVDSQDRVREMEMRKRRLRHAAQQRARSQQRANPAAVRPTRAAPAPEPRKYDKDCTDYYRKGRCRRILRPEWQRWNIANGGQNGKPTLRRKVGQD